MYTNIYILLVINPEINTYENPNIVSMEQLDQQKWKYKHFAYLSRIFLFLWECRTFDKFKR
jgi:hypothetical protein